MQSSIIFVNRNAGKMTAHSPDAHFHSSLGSSVISTRNHGILRGVSLKDSVSVLREYSKHKKELAAAEEERAESPSPRESSTKNGGTASSDHEEEPEDVGGGDAVVLAKTIAIGRPPWKAPPSYHRQTSASPTVRFGGDGVQDKYASTWEWPLGRPMVKNDRERFLVKLKVSPFKPEEVSVYISGSELMVHCASTGSSSNPNRWLGQIFRSYTLPLNVNPRSAEFILTRSGYIRIAILKEQPLKMAVAFETGGGGEESKV